MPALLELYENSTTRIKYFTLYNAWMCVTGVCNGEGELYYRNLSKNLLVVDRILVVKYTLCQSLCTHYT